MSSFKKKENLKLKNKKASKKDKKLNFFAGILIVIGSSIGAGIFFKSEAVLTQNNSSLILAIFSWIIASLAILLMALSLLEITSDTNGDLSIVGWNKKFNRWMVYQMSKNFSLYINIPITFFMMPLYAIMSFQDALQAFNINVIIGNGEYDYLIWITLLVLINLYLLFTSGLSAKYASANNNITLIFKILAIVASVVVALIYFVYSKEINVNWLTKNDYNPSEQVFSIYKFAPGIGLFISWAGIFFAYDGFYVATGISEELKEPKKAPKALMIGLVVVTILHLIIALSMSINGRGDFKKFLDFLKTYNYQWVFALINLFIGIGVIGIINGFSFWIPRFIIELIKLEEIPFSKKLKKLIKPHSTKVGLLYSLVLIFPIVFVFIVAGILFYPEKNDDFYQLYGSKMSSLYNFADLISNWISLIIFGFIALSCYGAIKDALKNKNKYPKWFISVNAIIVLFMGVVLVVNFSLPFVELPLLINQKNTLEISETLIEKINYEIQGKILSIIVFFTFIAIMILPPVFTKYQLLQKTQKLCLKISKKHR
ncbi:amino acid permease [Mycoplasmopsis ciconiae]|uniref:Amino acid permease n=1 Tax=Mycoplasmopsis ciconiae TaxID=561067 RepID=A0ABU7MKM9_9BACT|nr:amino acid permease [Mycoplasmopsis ciconiae]